MYGTLYIITLGVLDNLFSYVREHAAVIDHERKVMANVPGWVAGESVYHGGSWQAPGYTRFV